MKIEEILGAFGNAAARRIAYTTEQCYRTWICKFVDFLTTREARALDASEAGIELFLSDIRTTSRYGRRECESMASPRTGSFRFRPRWRAPGLDTPL